MDTRRARRGVLDIEGAVVDGDPALILRRVGDDPLQLVPLAVVDVLQQAVALGGEEPLAPVGEDEGDDAGRGDATPRRLGHIQPAVDEGAHLRFDVRAVERVDAEQAALWCLFHCRLL